MTLEELEVENEALRDKLLRQVKELSAMTDRLETLNYYHNKTCHRSRIQEKIVVNILDASNIPFYKKYFFKLKLWLIRKCL